MNEKLKSKCKNYIKMDCSIILDKLSYFAETAYAKNLSEVKTAANIEEANRLLKETLECIDIIKNKNAPSLKGTPDIREHIVKADGGGVLEPHQLRDIKLFMETVLKIKNFFQRDESLTDNVSKGSGVKIPQSLLEDLKFIITEEGKIRENATSRLKSLISQKIFLRQKIVDRMEKLMDKYSDKLQDKFWSVRGNRTVLPIKIEESSHIKGIIHGTSQTEKTAFIEPEEVVELNNEYAKVVAEIEEEINRILRELTNRVASEKNNLWKCIDFVTLMDLRFAKAKLSIFIGGSPFEFSRKLFLKALKPVQLLILRGENNSQEEVIPSTVLWEEHHRGMMIMGPNAGGKTVFLKSIGAASFLSRIGVLLPCSDGSSIRFYNRIFILAGDYQDISSGQSSFSGKMLALAEILKNAKEGDLVLLDEAFSSTSIREGLSLERAVVKYLSDRKIDFVLTTNQTESLKTAKEMENIIWGSMSFDPEDEKPTYEFHPYFIEESHAIDVVKKSGFPEEVIKMTKEFLGEDYINFAQIIKNLNLDREKLRKIQKEINLRLENIKLEEEKLKKERKKVQRELRKKFERDLKSLKNLIYKEINRIQEAKERQKLEKLEREVSNLEKKIAEPEEEQLDFSPAEGMEVRVRSTGAKGRIISLEDEKIAVIEIRGVRWTLPLKELEPC